MCSKLAKLNKITILRLRKSHLFLQKSSVAIPPNPEALNARRDALIIKKLDAKDQEANQRCLLNLIHAAILIG